MTRLVTIIYLLSGPILSLAQDAPTVNTPLGSLRGVTGTSSKGINYYSFKAVRYAEAPRFEPPVPVGPWDGTFDATQEGPICFQPGGNINDESEDCLRLNIHTRRINNPDDTRPVLVYIHGGSFVGGSGRVSGNQPQYLMDNDIVVVTINYRLGTLGFFSTGDEQAPGNYGMKDCVEALRWVQNNIKYFGGDASSVTLAGESAGGAAVSFLIVSPLARGLFHRAIVMSEAAKSWYPNTDALSFAKRQASLLNCPTDDTRSMVNCMKERPADQIANIYNGLHEWHDEPVVSFSPVVEAGSDDNEKFLLKDPNVALAQGDFAQIPVIIGTVRDEFANRAGSVTNNPDYAADMSTNWNTVAPKVFGYPRNDTISSSLRQFYLGSTDQPITSGSYDSLAPLYADSIIIFHVIRAARLMADTNSQPVYLYQFNYPGEGASGPNVYHAADMAYIFYNSPGFDPNSENGHCKDRVTTIWANFIQTGNPTPNHEEVLNNVIWTPYKNSNPIYLDMNRNLTLVNGLYYRDRMDLWTSLFPVNAN